MRQRRVYETTGRPHDRGMLVTPSDFLLKDCTVTVFFPDSASFVTLALEGDIEGLKDLFARGLASPRDVSATRGYPILRVSRPVV